MQTHTAFISCIGFFCFMVLHLQSDSALRISIQVSCLLPSRIQRTNIGKNTACIFTQQKQWAGSLLSLREQNIYRNRKQTLIHFVMMTAELIQELRCIQSWFLFSLDSLDLLWIQMSMVLLELSQARFQLLPLLQKVFCLSFQSWSQQLPGNSELFQKNEFSGV